MVVKDQKGMLNKVKKQVVALHKKEEAARSKLRKALMKVKKNKGAYCKGVSKG